MNETEVKDGCCEIYHVGMKDTWDIVRKIFDMNDYQRYAIFGSENSRYIMMNTPIGEVVEKLKTYEEIKAGDEVIYNNTTVCAVLTPETDKKYASIVDGYGNHYSADHRELKKTGKHYDHIEQLFAEMRGRWKSCSTCKHEFKLRCEWPCEDCLCHDRWESKGDAEKTTAEKTTKECSTCKYIRNVSMCNTCYKFNKWVSKDGE